MDGCIYRTRFNMCEKNKAEDEQKGIRRWCGFEDCTDRHPSNLDRLRTMSNEELAEFLEAHCFQDDWFDWLKREADI